MEYERKPPEAKKAEILNESPLLRFLTSEDFSVHRESWDENIQEAIRTMHSEIEEFACKELTPDIIQEQTAIWMNLNFNSNRLRAEHVSSTIETVILTGYEVGIPHKLLYFQSELFESLIRTQVFHVDTNRRNNFRGANKLMSDLLRIGTDARREVDLKKTVPKAFRSVLSEME